MKIEDRWYFVDPTVSLPTMKQPCVCGSGKNLNIVVGISMISLKILDYYFGNVFQKINLIKSLAH